MHVAAFDERGECGHVRLLAVELQRHAAHLLGRLVDQAAAFILLLDRLALDLDIDDLCLELHGCWYCHLCYPFCDSNLGVGLTVARPPALSLTPCPSAIWPGVSLCALAGYH